MFTEPYLARIGVGGPLDPTAETLHRLHLAHLYHVPFENLDIHLGRPIVLDVERFYTKIVTQRRGGFCYELNGLFAALLRALGYTVTLHSARVMGNDGELGPEFDHLVLLVRHDQTPLSEPYQPHEPPWLVDVGFGDSFREPLQLRADQVSDQAYGTYRVQPAGAAWLLQEQQEDGDWQTAYAFTRQPRDLPEFAAMCVHQQTSPQSHFTQKRVCSRATPEGRITLSDRRLIVTQGTRRTERTLTSEDDVTAVLVRDFGIDLRSSLG